MPQIPAIAPQALLDCRYHIHLPVPVKVSWEMPSLAPSKKIPRGSFAVVSICCALLAPHAAAGMAPSHATWFRVAQRPPYERMNFSEPVNRISQQFTNQGKASAPERLEIKGCVCEGGVCEEGVCRASIHVPFCRVGDEESRPRLGFLNHNFKKKPEQGNFSGFTARFASQSQDRVQSWPGRLVRPMAAGLTATFPTTGRPRCRGEAAKVLKKLG